MCALRAKRERNKFIMGELKVLIDETTIQDKVAKLAKQIEQDYEGKDLTLVGILKGSTVFMVDLARKMKRDVKFAFMQVSSYGTEKISAGKINLKLDLPESLEGENILIVEDIIDTGRTLTYVLDYLKQKNPNSIKIATMLSKPSRRVMELNVDYIGFAIEDKFVVGYGLDYNEKYRNLPYSGYIES